MSQQTRKIGYALYPQMKYAVDAAIALSTDEQGNQQFQREAGKGRVFNGGMSVLEPVSYRIGNKKGTVSIKAPILQEQRKYLFGGSFPETRELPGLAQLISTARIKEENPSQDLFDESLRVIEREAKITHAIYPELPYAGLGTVNIPTTEGEKGIYFAAVPFYEGVQLEKILRTMREAKHRESILREVAAAISVDTLQIVNRQQQLGIINRDIKSGNMIVDATGRVHVIDFGLAGYEEELNSPESKRKRKKRIQGSAAFMAPEQIRAMDLTTATDLYGIGLVLDELLRGPEERVDPDNLDSPQRILTWRINKERWLCTQYSDQDPLRHTISRFVQWRPRIRELECMHWIKNPTRIIREFSQGQGDDFFVNQGRRTLAWYVKQAQNKR